MYQHLLVPIDDSTLAGELTREAVAYAKSAGARITFFHAMPDDSTEITGEAVLLQTLDPDTFRPHHVEHARVVLDKAVAVARSAGVSCESLALASRSPYEGILEAIASSRCDLVFIASHGRRTRVGMMLGSVTLKILTHAHVPILVSSIGKTVAGGD